ncbi:alpha/beta fold hydrolase [Aureispira anguillae]|uniref:Alpha/beta fold hydrolase n=1 Tax=Aureispira anguillae TaxID=2864201 RepID=A0A915YBC2_9BACT|nr:alpha/beta fold hydrolase [Aureispira anguillae]BDS09946.1 alpha/beta fold hydrolase [Aureispira anguillae]
MQLNYKVFGEGEPVVILHGMFGTLDNWQTIAKQLAKHFMVFIIDLRNHGRSPHSEAFSYSIMANDVYEFMENNWIYEAHIVGHSMGGKVAMQLATENPDLVNKLAVVDIAPKAYKGNHQPIFDALFALDLTSLKSRKQANEFLESRIESYAVRQFILKNLSINKQTQTYEWKMNLPVIHNAYQHILGSSDLSSPYNKPTLFIKGANSSYILEEEFSDYQVFFPQAKLANIDNAGHWVHAEQPKLFLEALTNFLLDE